MQSHDGIFVAEGLFDYHHTEYFDYGLFHEPYGTHPWTCRARAHDPETGEVIGVWGSPLIAGSTKRELVALVEAHLQDLGPAAEAARFAELQIEEARLGLRAHL